MVEVVDQAQGENWALYCGDSAEVLAGIPTDSVHLGVTSIPFSSLYTYSPSDRDLGNSTTEQFWQHISFITDQWLRVTMPGRDICVHVQQLPLTKVTDGVIGIRDFRGETIRHYVDHGWIYHGEACVQKNPQQQAIRTHSKSLLFIQLHKDAAWMRPAFADYVLIFRKPGDNPTPVITSITNDEWIKWAYPIWLWDGIAESDTLNVAEARESEDERHICALQLQTIERCIRLWSNPGELVIDPFAGIGSTPYMAVKLGRKGLGCELKESYFRTAVANLRRIEAKMHRPTLFDALPEAAAS